MSETKKHRLYTQDERRRVLMSVYYIINTKAMGNRYSSTTFGMSLEDDPNAPEALRLCNLIECIAQMHNEIAKEQKEKGEDE